MESDQHVTDKLVARFKSLIEAQLIGRREQLPRELRRIDAEASANGSLRSSRRLLLTHEAIANEFAARAVLTWQSLVRVHTVFGSPTTPDTRSKFKVIFRKEIEDQSMLLSQELARKIEKSGIRMPGTLTLDEKISAVVMKHEVEIDLYFDSLELRAAQGQSSMNQTYNFYGQVGAVQTGVGATANSIQGLAPSDREALLRAIEEIKVALENQTTLGSQKSELIEIADECAKQISGESSNSTKLLSLLNVLGTTVQSMASAQPAYQALKAALLPLGIFLP